MSENDAHRSARSTREYLAVWKAITGHVIALVLTIGFFGVAFVSLLGVVQITDPTTAAFVGTVLGYSVASLAKPLSWYYETTHRDHGES